MNNMQPTEEWEIFLGYKYGINLQVILLNNKSKVQRVYNNTVWFVCVYVWVCVWVWTWKFIDYLRRNTQETSNSVYLWRGEMDVWEIEVGKTKLHFTPPLWFCQILYYSAKFLYYLLKEIDFLNYCPRKLGPD